MEVGRRPIPVDVTESSAAVTHVHLSLAPLIRGELNVAVRDLDPVQLVQVSFECHQFGQGVIHGRHFLVDLLGAFLLGALSAALARRAAPTRRQVSLRLFAATGFAGAFTTYGTLIGATWSGMETNPGTGVLLAAASSLLLLVLGVGAAGAGWLLVRSTRARRAFKEAEA